MAYDTKDSLNLVSLIFICVGLAVLVFGHCTNYKYLGLKYLFASKQPNRDLQATSERVAIQSGHKLEDLYNEVIRRGNHGAENA